jgi:glycerol-3-phosphate dehydrogenase subunit B
MHHPNGHVKTNTEVLVIGAGLAGLMAAVTAVKAGARVRLIASGWGQQLVAPGWISVCDRADDDVIAEVRGYAALHPDHPYALADDDAMVHSVDAFRATMKELGLPYDIRKKDGHNMRLITMLGAVQRVMMAPRGLANGDLTDIKGPVVLVGFKGWRDFNPDLAAGNLCERGIDASAVWIDPPPWRDYWDMWPSDIAHQFDQPEFRAEIARQLKKPTQGAAKIGFPAVLGLDHHCEALVDLQEQIGTTVFEIPTLPTSVPGLRLNNILRRWLLRQGVRFQIGHPVVSGIIEGQRVKGVEVESVGHRTPFYADHIILAAGGLYNGGILSDESGRLWEPIFDLPVQTPSGEGRSGWYHDTLLIERGHPIHRETGIRVNNHMRPLDQNGNPVFENLYAVGHMIAGFNPLTDGCAEGIALATAYKAVQIALGLDEL